MHDEMLGRLERVDLRAIWINEAVDFTPWLARPENISVLADTLGFDLEVEAQERAVGPFRADILCKDLGCDAWVLIENQLERTDHNHLGQLLTYAAGLQAVTIVWIAARFTEEHRATLDWLNRITGESFRFFGLEVELWKIGSSPAAPKFNIISQPNDWSKSVTEAKRAIDEGEPSETRLFQRDYWAALNVVLDELDGPVTGHKKPQLRQWMRYSIGKSGFNLAGVMHIQKRWIRAELYMRKSQAKAHFWALKEQKEEIEAALGYELNWEELPEGTDSRISISLDNVDFTDRSDWKRQHEWLARKLNEMHRVFSPKVQDLETPDEQE